MSHLLSHICKQKKAIKLSTQLLHNPSLLRIYFGTKPSMNIQTESELNHDVSEDVLRRRLIFRCKNRGIKELDLLMGNWAMENMDTLTLAECDELQTVLNEETLDLVSILLKTKQIPEHFQNNSVMRRLAEYRDAGNITGYAK